MDSAAHAALFDTQERLEELKETGGKSVYLDMHEVCHEAVVMTQSADRYSTHSNEAHMVGDPSGRFCMMFACGGVGVGG